MIKQPAFVRERVMAGAIDMLEHLRCRISMLPETELHVLSVIERPQQFDLAVDMTNYVMDRLGHTTAPKEPRFDKTRRALAKKAPRRGRGVLKAADKTLLSGVENDE